MEKQLVEDAGLDYIGISSGKLRRYFSWKNFSDPFRVLKGYFEAKKFMKKYKPDVVFSKGGFVTVPVVYAASKYKIPVIIHESDMTPDLLISLQLRSLQRYVITSLKLLHILVLRQYIQVHLSVRNYLKVIRLLHLICVVSLLTNL